MADNSISIRIATKNLLNVEDARITDNDLDPAKIKTHIIAKEDQHTLSKSFS